MTNLEIKKFEEEHYTYKEAELLFSRSTLQKLDKIKVKPQFATGKFLGCKFAYVKNTTLPLKEKKDFIPAISEKEKNSNLYILSSEAQKKLQVTAKKWPLIREEFSLKESFANYYLKKDIDYILELQNNFFDNYLNLIEVKEIIKINYLKKLKTYAVPNFAFSGKFKNRTTAFKKADILNSIELGHAKDSYYIKNNSDNIMSLTRRKNLSLEFISPSISSLDDFENAYFTFEEIQNLLTRKYQDLAEFINIPPHFKKGKFINKVKAYKKSKILELHNKQVEETNYYKITEEEEKSGIYISFKEACDLLDIRKDVLLKIRICLKLSEPKTGYVFKNDIIKVLNNYESFCNQHYSYDEAINIHPSSFCNKLDNVAKTVLPQELKIKKFNDGRLFAYQKDSLQLSIKKFLEIQEIRENSYSQASAIEFLELSLSTFIETIKIHNIKYLLIPIESSTIKSYSKVEILKIKKLQEEFLSSSEYLTYNEVLDLCTKSTWIELPDLKMLQKNLEPWNHIGKFNKCSYFFVKTDVLDFINKKSKYLDFLEDVNFNDPLESFMDKFTNYPFFDYAYYQKTYPLTNEFLISFCSLKILSSKASHKNITLKIRNLVVFSVQIFLLIENLNIKDIHTANTSQLKSAISLNHFLHKNVFTLNFLDFVHSTILKNSSIGQSNKKIFDIDKVALIFKNKNSDKKLLDATAYELDEFLNMINHCSNISLHIPIAVNEIITKKTIKHVSYWLLTSLNLNNAWRLGDLSNIPMLKINDVLQHLEIFDLNWFKSNTLNLHQARLILGPLNFNEYIVSKTKAYNNFFISDDLAIAVSSALAILALAHYENTNYEAETTPLMNFSTKFNYPAPTSLKNFFTKYCSEHFNNDFIYKNNKVTSTLLTLISAIQTDNCSESTLKLAQKIRAHKSMMSLLNYLKLDLATLNIITRNLFNRGEFGYIYVGIASALGLPTSTLHSPSDEKFDSVTLLNQTFSSPWELEVLTTTINNFETKQKYILENIKNSSFSELQKQFSNLAFKKSASRVMNLPCIIGNENCTTSKKDCIICPHSIPTVYSLNLIAKNLISLLLKYNTETLLGEKLKLSVKIQHYKLRVLEAIKHLGQSLVYSYMNITRDDFLTLLASIQTTDDLLKERITYVK